MKFFSSLQVTCKKKTRKKNSTNLSHLYGRFSPFFSRQNGQDRRRIDHQDHLRDLPASSWSVLGTLKGETGTME